MTRELEELELALSIPTSGTVANDSPNDVTLTVNGRKRKSRGGRISALDVRLDVNIDPKKAARIMANRYATLKCIHDASTALAYIVICV